MPAGGCSGLCHVPAANQVTAARLGFAPRSITGFAGRAAAFAVFPCAAAGAPFPSADQAGGALPPHLISRTHCRGSRSMRPAVVGRKRALASSASFCRDASLRKNNHSLMVANTVNLRGLAAASYWQTGAPSGRMQFAGSGARRNWSRT
jgi:hypothetical protein